MTQKTRARTVREGAKTLTPEKVLTTLEENDSKIRAYGVLRIGLFGSCARREYGEKSDLDFLVEFKKPTFKNYMGLLFFLEGLFRTEIDLITPEGLDPYVKNRVSREVVWHETG